MRLGVDERFLDLVSSKYRISEQGRDLLSKNLASGGRNIFIFYQANIAKGARYPVATFLFMLKDIEELNERLNGRVYLFYHTPETIAKVYNEDKYVGSEGKAAYQAQLGYIKKVAKEFFGLELELISIQDYAQRPDIRTLYKYLKEKQPFEESLPNWLKSFSQPAVKAMIKTATGSSTKVNEYINRFYIRDNNLLEAAQWLAPYAKTIVADPRFESYLIYELLANIGAPLTHDAILRPNQGANKAMQEKAAELAAQSDIQKLFGKERYYIPIYELVGLDLPFSFVHPKKEGKNIKLKIARANELADLEMIIDTKNKIEYFEAFDKRFPGWRKLLQKVAAYNSSAGIENVLPDYSEQTNALVVDINLRRLKTIQLKDSSAVDPRIKALITQREQMRTEKNFKEADKIRNILVGEGYYIQDESIGGRK